MEDQLDDSRISVFIDSPLIDVNFTTLMSAHVGLKYFKDITKTVITEIAASITISAIINPKMHVQSNSTIY